MILKSSIHPTFIAALFTMAETYVYTHARARTRWTIIPPLKGDAICGNMDRS